MKRSFLRPAAAVIVIAVTITVFVLYFVKHPEVRHQLAQTSPGVLAWLLALYLVSVVALAFVTLATLRLCKVKLDMPESLLLTMYAAIINFFGPLQSGPAFRAVYLKKKHGLSLKSYTGATLVYYFFYGGFSVVLLFSSLLKWWLIPISAAGLLAGIAIGRSKRFKPRLEQLDLAGWYYLAAATLSQIIVLVVIYYVEIKAVDPSAHFWQALVYTGAANLALFVSLTPGAIGFRESFLALSQHLHHIGNGTIVAANIIDRAVYVVLLLILALLIFGTHARRQLGVDKSDSE